MPLFKLYPLARRFAASLLKHINLGDITIHHHWTKDKFKLHSFKHKGYWYHGKKRELESMVIFSELIKEGDQVAEIGGHIGYISLYFAHLIGTNGHLVVFEPGPNNLPYLRENTSQKPHISIVEEAVTDYSGTATLHVENLTGQNNSLLEDYHVLEANKKAAGWQSVKNTSVDVSCTTFDDYRQRTKLPIPRFIKIDVEGAELVVLKGMTKLLNQSEAPIAMMIEVTEHSAEAYSLLKNAGFQIFLPNKVSVKNSSEMDGNIFCLKADDDRISVFTSD